MQQDRQLRGDKVGKAEKVCCCGMDAVIHNSMGSVANTPIACQAPGKMRLWKSKGRAERMRSARPLLFHKRILPGA